jgi:hypothetical protein
MPVSAPTCLPATPGRYSFRFLNARKNLFQDGRSLVVLDATRSPSIAIRRRTSSASASVLVSLSPVFEGARISPLPVSSMLWRGDREFGGGRLSMY